MKTILSSLRLAFAKNQVLISALISAIVLSLQQFMGNGPVSFKALGFALLISVIGVIANQWKGKGLTITGILGTLAGVFQNIYTTGTFTWNEFILSAIVAVLMAAAASLQPQVHTEQDAAREVAGGKGGM